jgi:hypothetical protein
MKIIHFSHDEHLISSKTNSNMILINAENTNVIQNGNAIGLVKSYKIHTRTRGIVLELWI